MHGCKSANWYLEGVVIRFWIPQYHLWICLYVSRNFVLFIFLVNIFVAFSIENVPGECILFRFINAFLITLPSIAFVIVLLKRHSPPPLHIVVYIICIPCEMEVECCLSPTFQWAKRSSPLCCIIVSMYVFTNFRLKKVCLHT